MQPVRPPAGWADAQRALAESVARGEIVPPTAVFVRWWTNPATWTPRYGGKIAAAVAGVQGVRMLIRRLRRGPAGTFVAVWRDRGTPDPDLVFRADPAELPSPDGTAEGTLLGECAPNGGLVVEFGGRQVRPVYNPQHATKDLTRRLRASR